MKKSLISAALILLLMLVLAPAAYADVVYPPPAPVELGEEMDHLAAECEPGTAVEVSEGALPPGVELELEQDDSSMYVYLRGRAEEAGIYNCVISIGPSNSFFCTVTVNAPRPSAPGVTASPDVVCYAGDSVSVSVSASAEPGTELRYQWYASTSRDSLTGAEIGGADGPEYSPGTAYPGTTYYYCVVTGVSGGQESAPAVSPAISVTVQEISVDSIGIESMPLTTDYKIGDALDTRGLQVRVFYSNGTQQLLDSGFGVYPTRLESAGEQEIEVSYQGLIAHFTVTVSQEEEVIEGIGILTLPARTDYTVGETLDASGLSIRAYTNFGYRDVTYELLTCEPVIFSGPGRQTITVRYGGQSCTFEVTVQDPKATDSIHVLDLPAKVSYTAGEALNTAGLRLKVVDTRGDSQIVDSGFSCSPTQLNTPGRQEITVSYDGKSTSFHVNVAAAAAAPASPSPSPVQPSASPALPNLTDTQASPSPSPFAAPAVTAAPNARASDYQSEHGGMGRSLIGVVVVAALLALAVLGAYVFVMNRGGVDAAARKLRKLFRRGRH